MIHHNLNPEWNQGYELPLTPQEVASHELCVQVVDHDWGLPDELIGGCYICFKGLGRGV